MKQDIKERLVEWLRNGEIERFNRYRKLTRYKLINLSKVDLSLYILHKADLSDLDLSESNFYKTDLFEADLSYSDLTGANFTNADLYKADFTGSNLIDANLFKAFLLKASFYGAHLPVHVFQNTGNGSVNREITYIPEYDELNAGCFSGTLDEFIDSVKWEYGHNKKTDEYLSYQDLIKYLKRKRKRYFKQS